MATGLCFGLCCLGKNPALRTSRQISKSGQVVSWLKGSAYVCTASSLMLNDFLQANWFGDEEGPGGVPPAVIF